MQKSGLYQSRLVIINCFKQRKHHRHSYRHLVHFSCRVDRCSINQVCTCAARLNGIHWCSSHPRLTASPIAQKQHIQDARLQAQKSGWKRGEMMKVHSLSLGSGSISRLSHYSNDRPIA